MDRRDIKGPVMLSVSFFLIFLELASGHSLEKRATDPANDLPEGWRDLISDEAYEYAVNKAKSIENMTSDNFEGDIAGFDAEAMDPASLSQNAIVEKDKLWPSGRVPYTVSSGFSSQERSMIVAALADLAAKTCLRFIPRTNERDYATFVSGDSGCNSYIGRVRGQQVINLLRGCVNHIGEVQHEVMHALGFFHEQTRDDRDRYVTIVSSNIARGQERNFNKYRGNTFGLPYDYNSIMHYGIFDFSKHPGRSPTIVPKVKASIGNRKVASATDIKKINLLYECQTSMGRRRGNRGQHNNRLSNLDAFFANFGESPMGSESAGPDDDSTSSTANIPECPTNSPHKTRNDLCANNQDCLDSGLGSFCCPNCADKNCTYFCS